MFIEKITIQKFRSILKETIHLSDINAIVGQNNSGKSSLLRALNVFFHFEEEKTNLINGAHSYSPLTRPKIEITFTNIPNDNFFSKFIYNNKLIIQVTFLPKSGNIKIEYKISGGYQTSDEKLISKIKEHINFIFIPPNRDGKQLTDTENNILQLLLEEHLNTATQNRDNYSTRFQYAAEFLENNALKKIAKEAHKEYALKNKFDFKIKFDKVFNYKDFLNHISISLVEQGLTHSLPECGTGIQSLTIIALYSLLGKLRNENIIIGLEEPETNLHPQAQRELVNALKKLVENNEVLQVFFTTHSTVLIDEVEHEQVILYRKVNDTQRGFKTITNQIPSNFFENYELNEFKYYQFYRYKNSDFFFSKFIILVESKNEIEVIKNLSEKFSPKIDLSHFTFINLSGVDSIRYPFYLLEELNIPYLMIVDRDFFTPYLNDSLKESRNQHGYPLYRKELKNIDILSKLIKRDSTRRELLRELFSSHTRASEILIKHNVICMRFTLEIDLIATTHGAKKYYELLAIQEEYKNEKTLLVDNCNVVKNIRNILKVCDDLELKNLPFSYRRIRNFLIEKVKEFERA